MSALLSVRDLRGRHALAPLGAGPESYAGRLHPAFGVGRRIVISFYEPRIEDDRVVGRVHLARVTFE